MPGEAPSSGLRRTGVLATGAPRRVAARGACDALRRTPAEVFLLRRVVAVGPFGRWGGFSFPALFVGFPALVWGFSEKNPKINLPQGGGAGGPWLCFFS